MCKESLQVYREAVVNKTALNQFRIINEISSEKEFFLPMKYIGTYNEAIAFIIKLKPLPNVLRKTVVKNYCWENAFVLKTNLPR